MRYVFPASFVVLLGFVFSIWYYEYLSLTDINVHKKSTGHWTIQYGEHSYDCPEDELKQIITYSLLIANHDRYGEDPKRQKRDLRPGMRQGTNSEDFNDQVFENKSKIRKLNELASYFKPSDITFAYLRNINTKISRFNESQTLNFSSLVAEFNGDISKFVSDLLEEQSPNDQFQINSNSHFFSIFLKQLAPQLPKIHFLKIEKGSYIKGTPATEPSRDHDEDQKKVTIQNSFDLSATEITQLDWFNLVGYNPSYFNLPKYCPKSHMTVNQHMICPKLPVEQVSFHEVTLFLEKLNRLSANKGWHYRLPKDDEWEYAARAGTKSLYSFGNDPKQIDPYSWHFLNSNKQPHPVATKKPNPWGLHDMHGNVWEWIDTSYTQSKEKKKNLKIWRGGGFLYCERRSRSSYKLYGEEEYRSQSVGFRIAREPSTKQR